MKNRRKMLSTVIIILIGMSMLSLIPHQAKSATSDPVAHWTFDEGSGSVAHDSSGQGNDGTISGAEWVTGISGSALRFRNTTTYMMAGFPSVLAGNHEFTISFWTKIITWPTEQYAYLIMLGNWNSLDGLAFHVLLDNDDGYGPYGTVRANFWGSHVWTVHTFATEVWYNWAFVYDKTQVKMYQNGTFLENIGLGGASPNLDAAGSLWLSNPTGQRFDGVMDELAIYDYARSSGDILNDYNSIIHPQTSQNPVWMQWWFWTIIALAAIVVGLAFATIHYRRKPHVSKETNVTQSKTSQKASKICPKCGASLPADSKFCGKCGTSLD